MIRNGAYRLSRQGQRGFVVIYVAAIIIFLMGVVLQGTREMRYQAKVSISLQEQSAMRTRLQAAVTWLIARINLQWRLATATPPTVIDLMQAQPKGVSIDGVTIKIATEDAELRPDVNLLDEAGWNRLFAAYGVPPAQAADLARKFFDARQRVGVDGFTSITDVTEDPRLPAAMVDGLDNPDGISLPPLSSLMSVGRRRIRLHVNNTPLPLFAVLLGATAEQLDALQHARQSRKLTVADAELIFGEEQREKFYDGNPQILSYRLKTDTLPTSMELLVAVENGKLVFGPPRSL